MKLLRCSTTMLMAILATVHAAGAQEASTDLPPDAAFSKYVDSALLQDALDSFDASQMADVALLLAEGERVLQRSHAAMTADDAFALTIQYAVASGDKATIERLVKAAAAGKKSWSEKVEQVRGLIASSRAAAPSLSFEKYGPQGQEAMAAVENAIQAARVSGDRATLEEVEKALKESTALSDLERGELLKLAVAARGQLPDKPNPEVAGLLDRLAGESRSTQPPGTLAIDLSGAATVVPVKSANIILTNNLGAGGTVATAAGTVAISNGQSIGVVMKPKTTMLTIVSYKWIKMPMGKTIKVPHSTKLVPLLPGFGLTGGKKVTASMK